MRRVLHRVSEVISKEYDYFRLDDFKKLVRTSLVNRHFIKKELIFKRAKQE